MSMLFSERVKEKRLEKGWTQAVFAEKSGVPQSTISAIETGVRKPTFETIKMIADGLGCSVDDLMGDERKEKRPTVNDDDGPKEKLIDLLVSVPEQDAQRVRDFVAGLIAARRE